jgi:hypothetical protein
MNCNDCGGFLPHGCDCSPFGGRARGNVSMDPQRKRELEGQRPISITVGGSTHTRTADEWLALARADLKAKAGVALPEGKSNASR